VHGLRIGVPGHLQGDGASGNRPQIRAIIRKEKHGIGFGLCASVPPNPASPQTGHANEFIQLQHRARVSLLLSFDVRLWSRRMPDQTPRRGRECREYERLWHGHCVDRNLKDGWLEALNALETLNFISICEGHLAERPNSPRTRPHINLRLKPSFLPQAVKTWDTVRSALESRLASMFDFEDTSAAVELKLRVRLCRNGCAFRHDLTACIEARQARVSAEMDAETSDWFRRTVESIKGLDRLFNSQLRCEAIEAERSAPPDRPHE
jgi:hypothetical protein